MPCPRDWNGIRECDIVPHPDYPNEQSFCTVCDRRFSNRGVGPSSGPSFGASLLRAIVSAFAVLLLLQAIFSSGSEPSEQRNASPVSQSITPSNISQ